MKNIQIVYKAGFDNNSIDSYFCDEAEKMHNLGFLIGIEPNDNADYLIFRGTGMDTQDLYPVDERYINGWIQNKRTRFFSLYYPHIQKYSIDTFFTDNLNSPSTLNEIKRRGWTKVFIKRETWSLQHIKENGSVWPDTPFEWMVEQFEKRNIKGPYAVREYIDNKEIFYDEQRYWVLDGIAHHPSGRIPPFVQEAATRLYKFSGSRYFTIDVAGDYIVEVNPGESSDRGGDNPLEFFCNIFAKSFLDK